MSPLISVHSSKITEYTLLVNISLFNLVCINLQSTAGVCHRSCNSISIQHRSKLRDNSHIHLYLYLDSECHNIRGYSCRYVCCCRDIQQFLSSGHPVELKHALRVLRIFLLHGNQVYELDRKNIQDKEPEEWCKLGTASSFMKGSGSEWT